MSVEEAAQRLAQEMVRGSGVHQLSTLNPAKVRVLAALHYLGRASTCEELATALDWTAQYAYRMADELAEQGVLIRSSGPRHRCNGRFSTLFRCVCSNEKKGTE